MEKRTSHYSLNEIKSIVAEKGIASFSRTALNNGIAMGLRPAEMVAVVLDLTAGDFYKSMTTYHDHTLWQDVYRARTLVGKTAYIKATLHGGSVIIQFKEK